MLLLIIWHRDKPGTLWQPEGVGWGGGDEREIQEEGTCTPMTNSCRCMAEMNTTL